MATSATFLFIYVDLYSIENIFTSSWSYLILFHFNLCSPVLANYIKIFINFGPWRDEQSFLCDYYQSFFVSERKCSWDQSFSILFEWTQVHGKSYDFEDCFPSTEACFCVQIHVYKGSYNRRKVKKWDAVLDGIPFPPIVTQWTIPDTMAGCTQVDNS